VIFVTVGHQMPFDRLIRGVDEWAASNGRADVFAQVGSGEYVPRHIEHADKIDPEEFRRRMGEADAVVAHAGMGSILTALELGVPILVMPRLGRLMETRNDHQVATAERFREQGRIEVAMDETELPAALDRLTGVRRPPTISAEASPELLSAVRGFIFGAGTPK
jgi:UDP-N-acetylglucosamine transferase subunit ALG13